MAKKKDNFIGMGKNELEKKLASLRESVRIIHFKTEGAKSKNVKELASLKKDIARILTQMNSKK